MGEEELEPGEVGGGGEFGVGMGVFQKGDGVVEEFDGGGVVGEGALAAGGFGVGFVDEGAVENLGGFHGPEAVAVEGLEVAGVAVAFDGIGHAVGKHDGFFAAHDFEQGDELLGTHKGAGAVVDEDGVDLGGKIGQGVGHGLLASLAAAHEAGGGGGVGGEFEHLPLVAVNDDVVVGHGGRHEGEGAVVKEGFAGEGGEDLVGDDAVHAATFTGGEEDGGGAAHGVRKNGVWSWEMGVRSCLGRGEFGLDGAGGGGGVGGGEDGAADDDVGGAGAGGIGGAEHAFLVAGGEAARADAGGDEGGAGGEGGAQGGDFEGRADEAAQAGGDGEVGEAVDLKGGGGGHADGGEGGVVHGGEHGDAEEEEVGVGGLLGGAGGGHHLGSAGGMKGEHFDGERSEGLDGLGDGVGDVVEFEVEEDVVAVIGDLAEVVGAVGGEHLQADLDPTEGALELAQEGGGGGAVGEVEGENEFAGHVEG